MAAPATGDAIAALRALLRPARSQDHRGRSRLLPERRLGGRRLRLTGRLRAPPLPPRHRRGATDRQAGAAHGGVARVPGGVAGGHGERRPGRCHRRAGARPPRRAVRHRRRGERPDPRSVDRRPHPHGPAGLGRQGRSARRARGGRSRYHRHRSAPGARAVGIPHPRRRAARRRRLRRRLRRSSSRRRSPPPPDRISRASAAPPRSAGPTRWSRCARATSAPSRTWTAAAPPNGSRSSPTSPPCTGPPCGVPGCGPPTELERFLAERPTLGALERGLFLDAFDGERRRRPHPRRQPDQRRAPLVHLVGRHARAAPHRRGPHPRHGPVGQGLHPGPTPGRARPRRRPMSAGRLRPTGPPVLDPPRRAVGVGRSHRPEQRRHQVRPRAPRRPPQGLARRDRARRHLHRRHRHRRTAHHPTTGPGATGRAAGAHHRGAGTDAPVRPETRPALRSAGLVVRGSSSERRRPLPDSPEADLLRRVTEGLDRHAHLDTSILDALPRRRHQLTGWARLLDGIFD